MSICIIPARGGSTRIPRKNIKMFHGKPIIQYSMAVAEASGLFSDIVVSTDDQKIAALAHDLGVRVHPRPSELALDEVGTQEVARAVLIHEKAIGYREYDYACVLYATAPMVTVADLKEGHRLKVAHPGFAYLHSVDEGGRDCGAFYWGNVDDFIFNTPLEENSLKLTIKGACDINTREDWKRAEEMYGHFT